MRSYSYSHRGSSSIRKSRSLTLSARAAAKKVRNFLLGLLVHTDPLAGHRCGLKAGAAGSSRACFQSHDRSPRGRSGGLELRFDAKLAHPDLCGPETMFTSQSVTQYAYSSNGRSFGSHECGFKITAARCPNLD